MCRLLGFMVHEIGSHSKILRISYKLYSLYRLEKWHTVLASGCFILKKEKNKPSAVQAALWQAYKEFNLLKIRLVRLTRIIP